MHIRLPYRTSANHASTHDAPRRPSESSTRAKRKSAGMRASNLLGKLLVHG